MKTVAVLLAVGLLAGCGGGAEPQGGQEVEPLRAGAVEATPAQYGPVGGYLTVYGPTRRSLACPRGTSVVGGSCTGGALVTVASQGVDPRDDAWACDFVLVAPGAGPWSYADQEADVTALCQ